MMLSTRLCMVYLMMREHLRNGKKNNSGLRQRVYKKWKSGQYQLCDVHNPMVGSKVLPIVHTVTNCIVMRKSDLSSIVKGFDDESKGDGAHKLVNHGIYAAVYPVNKCRKTQMP